METGRELSGGREVILLKGSFGDLENLAKRFAMDFTSEEVSTMPSRIAIR
jgi:hypothetical protein